MSELERILLRYEAISEAGLTAALASVVSASGSTYRRIGAHMLITDDGEVVGAIKRGCLERDVCRHATWAIQSGKAKHLVYDSTGDGEGAEDVFALGCNGVVEILVERLQPGDRTYLGIVGPKRRTERLLADLAVSGSVATETQLGRLYGPVGLDLGAETPEEVALAIVAEMKAVLAGRTGGPSRQRPGALHERISPTTQARPSGVSIPASPHMARASA